LYEYDKVVLEVDGTGDQVARNLYGINLLMRDVDEDSYYYVYNGHADVTALINASTGNVEATYYYDPFGNILESTGDVNNNITYAGYQYDEETELYYLNARMYDPKVARFLQEDTYRGDINDPLSLNLYAYCANNPIVYYDPTGYNRVSKWWGRQTADWKAAWNVLTGPKDERDAAFTQINRYAIEENSLYISVVSDMGAALAGAVDAVKDPTQAYHDVNKTLFKPFVTQTLGVEEESNTYKALRYIGFKAEAVSIYSMETTKGLAGLGAKVVETAYDSTMYSFNPTDIYRQRKVEENRKFWSSLPSAMIDGITTNVETIFTPEKAYNFFLNPNASLEDNVEYFSATTSTVLTVYGGGKLLQSGHNFLKGIRFETPAALSISNSGAAAQSGIGITVEAGLAGNLVNSSGFFAASIYNNRIPKKGQDFRGGSKKDRDQWYGYDDKNFKNWWHRKGKKEWGGEDLLDKEMVKEAYEYWVEIGKPKVK
ncbi:MAG: RHS repeat-associated core domain-containing protein, partial [Clostridiaceae bacterium]|nr:RHS repeat-associated core domain-containing protein [Clostridiaceae bacterium]